MIFILKFFFRIPALLLVKRAMETWILLLLAGIRKIMNKDNNKEIYEIS